jgi:CheY-like chemotaxis protein
MPGSDLCTSTRRQTNGLDARRLVWGAMDHRAGGLERAGHSGPGARLGASPGDAVSPDASPLPARSAPRWILVADDDHGVRRLLAKVLEAAGYTVLLAGDGVEACELVRDLRPHLIILDLRMPRMSGPEFLRYSGEIPVLVLSGYLRDLPGAPDAPRAPGANIVGRLEKPVDLGVLRARVREALEYWSP